MPKQSIPVPEATKATSHDCRLPVLPYKGWEDEWAKFYVHVPLHVPIMDTDREWLFATKEEAEGFARWLDQMLGMLEYFWAKEKMARYGKTVTDAANYFIAHRDSVNPDELEKDSGVSEQRSGQRRRRRRWN